MSEPVQVTNGGERDPTLRLGGEITAVPPQDGLVPSAERSFSDEERLEPLVAEAFPTKVAEEERLGFSTPVVEKDGSGVVVLKQDWRVQTVNNGTTLQYDWSHSIPLKPRPVLHTPGEAMV